MQNRQPSIIVIVGVMIAVITVCVWAGGGIGTDPEHACLAEASARLIDGRPVKVRASIGAISSDGRQAQVSLTDGCNDATCTANKVLIGWTAQPGTFWTLKGCLPPFTYEYVEN